jgi:hypothetical protein
MQQSSAPLELIEAPIDRPFSPTPRAGKPRATLILGDVLDPSHRASREIPSAGHKRLWWFVPGALLCPGGQARLPEAPPKPQVSRQNPPRSVPGGTQSTLAIS